MGRLKPTLILGGPGCGKTTALLKVVEQAFSRGVEPDRIAFVAFTRKAAQEARERMADKFGLVEDKIPYFKTLHSFAYAHVDVSAKQILTREKMLAYAKAEGISLTPENYDEFGMLENTEMTLDDRAFQAMSFARLTRQGLSDVCAEEDLDFDYVSALQENYDAFKREHILHDFTDLIEQFCTEATIPAFDLLIVDEAQDLSHSQWLMVDRLMDESKDIYFAGDDDQAIYEWAGADVQRFLTLDADREILPTSYRLKRDVFLACQDVIAMASKRYEKDWSPHAEGGSIEYATHLEDLDLSHGTWFLLARTNELARKYIKFLQAEGYPYATTTRDKVRSSVEVPAVRAVLVYENLRKGKRFAAADLDNVWTFVRRDMRPEAQPVHEGFEDYGSTDLASTGLDVSASWIETLQLPGAMRDYIAAIRTRGESLVKKPRITVSTFHGVKGGEADHVAIMQQLSPRNYKTWADFGDPEIRALFTGISRAKESVTFLNASSYLSYNVERILT